MSRSRKVSKVNVFADQGVRYVGTSFMSVRRTWPSRSRFQQPPIDPHVGRHILALLTPQRAVVDPVGVEARKELATRSHAAAIASLRIRDAGRLFRFLLAISKAGIDSDVLRRADDQEGNHVLVPDLGGGLARAASSDVRLADVDDRHQRSIKTGGILT